MRLCHSWLCLINELSAEVSPIQRALSPSTLVHPCEAAPAWWSVTIPSMFLFHPCPRAHHWFERLLLIYLLTLECHYMITSLSTVSHGHCYDPSPGTVTAMRLCSVRDWMNEWAKWEGDGEREARGKTWAGAANRPRAEAGLTECLPWRPVCWVSWQPRGREKQSVSETSMWVKWWWDRPNQWVGRCRTVCGLETRWRRSLESFWRDFPPCHSPPQVWTHLLTGSTEMLWVQLISAQTDGSSHWTVKAEAETPGGLWEGWREVAGGWGCLPTLGSDKSWAAAS